MPAAIIASMMIAGLLTLAPGARAQPPAASDADAALVQRIKDAVIKELREGGALDNAIDAGVNRYVERQRAEAADRERLEADASAKAVRAVTRGRDHIRGNPDAQVTLIEYSDFECPFCKRFHQTAKQAVDQSGGKLRWVYRHFPLDELHSKARKEAAASECAAELGGNDAFWKFADRFYALTPSNNRTDVNKVLAQIARELGLDKTAFESCLASGRHDRRVQEDHENAMASGGRGTPWSIVVAKSGRTYPLSGAQPYAAVKQLIDLALRDR